MRRNREAMRGAERSAMLDDRDPLALPREPLFEPLAIVLLVLAIGLMAGALLGVGLSSPWVMALMGS
jgi:hypothetical protein